MSSSLALSETMTLSETTAAAHWAPGMPDDRALVDAAQSGDSLAFIELCHRHSGRLLRQINRVTKNPHDAEDALQDALLSAYRNLNKFENRSAFSSWLARIGINSALMLLRKKRTGELSFDDSFNFVDVSDSVRCRHRGLDPEHHYQWQESRTLLNAEIRRLPRLLRTVTELRVDQECSVSEIARVLEISESAVKSRLGRARSRLRDALAGNHRRLEIAARRREAGVPCPPARSGVEARRTCCSLEAA